MEKKGKYIMVDGLTGSGKSTVLHSVQEWARACGHRVFLLHQWTEHRPPTYNEIQDYDVYFTFEPSRTWIGSAIRAELSGTESPYGGEEIAHAFALDREIMYRRLILPAREAGKIIVQDRGVASSLVYQPMMPHGLTLEEVMDLPGNRLALEHAPDDIIFTQLDAHRAFERIQARQGESKGVYAQLEFLQQQQERFQSAWLHTLFTDRGTNVHTFDTSGSLETTQTQATNLIKHLLTTC